MNFAALSITSQSLFGAFKSDSLSINNSSFSTSASGASAFQPILTFERATLQQLQYLATKKGSGKKPQLQFGAQLQYGSYNTASTQVYLSNTLLSNGGGNGVGSGTGTISTVNRNQARITKYTKNKFLSIGVVLGVQKNIISINNKPKVDAYIQVVPSVNLYQSIHWFNKTTAEVAKNNQHDAQVQMFTNIGFNYLFKVKATHLNIGPAFSFSNIKLNKTQSSINNVYVNSMGVKLGIRF